MPSHKRKRPKGVVDTSVLVAGIAAFKRAGTRSIVPSAQMLRAWIENDTFQWLITEEILDEYKEILARCKVRRDLIAHAISLIRTAAQLVPDVPGYGISPDPDDEPFCACAEVGNADFIVTLNPSDFPQKKLRAHVIAPGDTIPTTGRTRRR